MKGLKQMHTISNFEKEWPEGTLTTLFNFIYGQTVAGYDCVEWAVKALSDGFESDNLSVLAGFDLEPYNATDPRERAMYFRRAIKEFRIDIFGNPQDVEMELSKIICQALLLDKIDGREALALLDQQFAHDDCNIAGPFLVWRELNTYLELRFDDQFPFRDCNILDYNPEELIRIVVEQYLVLLALPLPHDFYESVLCNQCEFFGKWAEKDYQIFCPKCGSKNVYPMASSYAGREIFLATFGKET